MANGQDREEVFFFITERAMTIQELLETLYVVPRDNTREHFLHVNAHIDPNNIRPGQLVVVTPANPTQCTELEYAFAEMARHVEVAGRSDTGADDRTPEVVNRFYDLLSFVDSQTPGAVGAFATAYGNRVKRVAEILSEIEDLYVSTYNRHGRINLQSFFDQRRIKFRQLDEALGQLVRSRLFDPHYTRMRRALGLSTRSTLNTWRRQGRPVSNIPGFQQHYERVGRLARHLRWLGYAGIGLDGYYSYRQIQEACSVDNNDPACTRRKFTEGGRLTGSIGGGVVGGGIAAYGVCNLILGLPSGGTSLLWCGVLAGGAGAFAGGTVGGAMGEATGEFVYENTYSAAP